MSHANIGFQGWFKFEAVSAVTGRRRTVANWFPNLILNNGLNLMGTTAPLGRCMVGTGTSTPVVSQTQLDTRIASTTTVQSTTYGSDLVDNYAYVRRVYRFDVGVAAGNLTEVGVGNSDTSCFSRALILDGGGSPTSVTVLSDEYLDVTYEVRCYPVVTDVLATVNIGGVNYDTIIRPSQFGAWGATSYLRWPTVTGGMAATPNSNPNMRSAGTLGDYTVTAGGTSLATGTTSYLAYSNNSYELTQRLTFGLTAGSTDFGILEFYNALGRWKISFDPVVPKRSTNIFTLDFKLAWARKTI